MHGISQRHSSRSWMLSWALLALLSFAAGRAHAQQYTAPYTYAPTYAYGRPYAGSYSYPAAVPSVAPVYGYNSYTVGSSPTVAGYRYLDDYAAGRNLMLAKPWMAPLR